MMRYPASPHPLTRAMPVLECSGLARSVAFYKAKLGFDAVTFGDPPSVAILQRGTVTLALALAAPPAAVSRRTWAAYIFVASADALYAVLTALGVAVPEPPETRPYNCRDFVIDDPNGHTVAFGPKIEPSTMGPGLSGRVGRDGEGQA